MSTNRRSFMKQAAMGSVASPFLLNGCLNERTDKLSGAEDLDHILARPVLKTEFFPDPVIIKELELMRFENNFICRVTSKDGAEGISVSNNMQMVSLWPIFIQRIQPYFIGKDATQLENLLDGLYVYQSNYKLQGLALWVPLATAELAILDMLGKISGKSISELIGKIHNTEIAVYQANNFRGRSAGESIQLIIKNAEETGAKALKFKVGSRMSNNRDFPPGRTESLIPLVRDAFGDDMTIYADANGSYTVDEAIRIGRILEEYRIDFYEEPVPFDWYEETKQVADALNTPIAGGEQEPAMWNFRWLIHNNGLDIVQPDVFYFGGMIRSMKVAMMAAARGKICIPHISGSGLGYLYMMLFVGAIPNAGPYHEFKGFSRDIPFNCDTSDLIIKDGKIRVPTGPGSGVIIDPGFIARHKPVSV